MNVVGILQMGTPKFKKEKEIFHRSVIKTETELEFFP